MERPTLLEVRGPGGVPVTCVLHARRDDTSSALVLPGAVRAGGRLGGSPARPDLSFVSMLLRSLGIAVLEVWWDLDDAPPGEEDDWLEAIALAAARSAAARGGLRVAVGRSTGTVALARVIGDGVFDRLAASLWIAPLLHESSVRTAIAARGAGAFVTGGAADPLFEPGAAGSLRDAGATVVVLPAADHALCVDDPAASARLLGELLDDLRAFLVDRVGGASSAVRATGAPA
jgi:hypothetical protein